MPTTTLSAFALALAAATGGASGSDVTSDELRNRIADLEARLAQVEKPADDAQLTEERAAEIRSIVHDVLADADTRASLLQGGMSAGHDGRFFLASADGNFRLNLAGRTQIRYIYNFQDESSGDTNRSGFENRRNRLAFSGHVVDPSWGYQIQGDFSRSGGGFTLLDAYVDKKFDNGMTLRIGQFRTNFMKEDSTSSARQLLVERSMVNSKFAQSRSQGLELRFDAGDNVKLSAAFTDGLRTANTNAQARTTEFAFTGRAEVLLAGNWRQFREFTSWQGEEFGAMVGVAAHYQMGEFGTADLEEEIIRWTVDGMFKFGGANVFAAFVGNHFDVNGGGRGDQYGFVLQGGFMVAEDIEIFARYEWGDADSSGIEDLNVVTFGVTKFFAKHNVKWTTDIGIGLDEVNSFWASSSAGWRADAADEDGQVVIRSQLQLAF